VRDAISTTRCQKSSRRLKILTNNLWITSLFFVKKSPKHTKKKAQESQRVETINR
jgi:hypothetical protein